MKLGTIILFLILILAVLAVCLFLGYKGYSPFDKLYTPVAAYISGFSIQNVINNPSSLLPAAGAGGIGITGIAALWSKLSSLKQQATAQISSLTKTKDDLTAQLTAEKNKLTEQFNSQISKYKTEAETASKLAEDYKLKFSNINTNFETLTNQKSAAQNQVELLTAQVNTLKAKLETAMQIKSVP